MKTPLKTFEFKHLMVLTAHGTVDLMASKAALKSLVAAPGFDVCAEVLIDLRDAVCEISVTQVYELSRHMAQHVPALSDNHRIAVVVGRDAPGNLVFNHALFIELCAHHRGLNIRAYGDYENAVEWLGAVLPDAVSDTAPARAPRPSAVVRWPQFGLG